MHNATSRGSISRGALPVRATALAAFALAITQSISSEAATWPTAQTTPSLGQLVAVDATGAPDWPYGTEDLLGDGTATFPKTEQAIDLRTVYATTEAQRFWVRAYVADDTAVSTTAVVYVFVDADQTLATGGTTAAPEIDPGLTALRPLAGYEHVVGIRGNGTLAGLWDWNQAQSQYVAVHTNANNAVAEAGRDTDPIFLSGVVHGYVQASVEFSLVGFATTCSANLDVRLVSGTVMDDAMEQTLPCVPIDHDADHVPDIVIPPAGCTADAQCPAAGRCVNGACVVVWSCSADNECGTGDHCVNHTCIVATSCTVDSECGSGNRCVDHACAVATSCTADSECGTGYHCVNHACSVATSCTVDSECGAGNHCVNRVCVATAACTADTECGAGYRCASGQCVVQGGGACTSNATCGDAVCRNGQCAACTAGGSECGAGRECTSGGRCVAIALAQGENVEGGAFHCGISPGRSSPQRALGLAAIAALALMAHCGRSVARRGRRARSGKTEVR